MSLSDYPAALDTFPVITPSTQEDAPGFEHDVMHNKAFDAIGRLQAKVGIDGSADELSLEARIAALESSGGAPFITGTNSVIDSGENMAFTPTLHNAPSALWELNSGSLPVGASLDQHTGAHSGTLSTVGTYSWELKATVPAGSVSFARFSATVLAPTNPVVLSVVMGKSHTVPMPASFAEGDLVLVAVTVYQVGIGTPAGWTKLGISVANTYGSTQTWFYRVMQAGDPSSVIFNAGGQSAAAGHAVYHIQAGTFSASIQPMMISQTGKTAPSLTTSWNPARTLWISSCFTLDFGGYSCTGYPYSEGNKFWSAVDSGATGGGAAANLVGVCHKVIAQKTSAPTSPFVLTSGFDAATTHIAVAPSNAELP